MITRALPSPSFDVRRWTFNVRRFSLRAWTAPLFTRLARCAYCRHIIRERAPLADANETTGCCTPCRTNERRRNHYSARPIPGEDTAVAHGQLLP